MLRPEDRQAIDDLFERLRNVDRNSDPRDADAEALIRRRLTEFPAAAYYMAQTIIVQEAALREQRAEIEALEAEQARRSARDHRGQFGDEPQHRQRGPWDRDAGGGFLAGAAQTALGVTGGLLLGSMLTGLFSSPAEAGEQAPEPEDHPIDDGGGDDGDWGGFDIGGEF